ncbi:MAG: sarcosine oxidase subunit gamma family protein [Pseudomonadota bacterium]
MSNAVSALQGAEYQGYVTVREMGLQGMISLRGDLASAKLKKAVKAVTGQAIPGQRGFNGSRDGGVGWMSPDELLLLVPYREMTAGLAEMETALTGEHYLAANVSDARALFCVEGDAAREVIAKLCPVDMSADGFGPGQIRRTRMAQIPAALWMPSEGQVEIVCFRSVAQYAFDLLKDAAEPGGEIGLF